MHSLCGVVFPVHCLKHFERFHFKTVTTSGLLKLCHDQKLRVHLCDCAMQMYLADKPPGTKMQERLEFGSEFFV